jgi:Rrf2 family protein
LPQFIDNGAVKITAAVEYAMQALLEIADPANQNRPVTAKEIAKSQNISVKFLESILTKLKQGSILVSVRGPAGGYQLAREPVAISVADVIRCIEGPLAAVGEKAPELAKYKGSAKHLTNAWIATRVGLREVLEEISLANLIAGKFPKDISALLNKKDAWKRR